MARRRTPNLMHSISSSSADFEESIPLMVSGPRGRSHGVSAASSLRISLLRCRSRVVQCVQNGSAAKWKLALACFASLATMVVLLKSPRAPNADVRRGSNYLRAHDASNATAPVVPVDDAQSGELLEALYDLPLPTSHEELNQLNEEFVDLDPELILRWAHHHLKSPRLVQVTSFGPTGLVILHMLFKSELLKDVPIITMDTLHLFPESYDFYETIRNQYENDTGRGGKAMELIVTKPLRISHPPGMNGEGVLDGVIESRKEFDEAYGSQLWKTDRQKFTRLTKIEPLTQALIERQVQMWITGRRRSSGGERADMDVLEFEPIETSVPDRSSDDEHRNPFDTMRGRWKLNPLAYWTYDQVWNYIRKHKLPYNVLYEKGYTSLGDEMTTGLPTTNKSAGGAVDEFERSGRFIGMGDNNECGLHSHIEKVKKMKQEASDAGEELTAPVLVCDNCVDLNTDNFEGEITTGETGDVALVEFYSPYCGGCQEFAPTLNKIANELSRSDPPVKVVRFDITENEIPKVNGEEMFQVESTPTLYRVRHSPSFQADLYEGRHTLDSILRWVKATPEDETHARRMVAMLAAKETKKGNRGRGVRHRVDGGRVRKTGH